MILIPKAKKKNLLDWSLRAALTHKLTVSSKQGNAYDCEAYYYHGNESPPNPQPIPKDTLPQSEIDPNPSEEKVEEKKKRKRELDNNPIINQDPSALLFAYDNAGRPRHDESCTDDFLLQRGVTPKKQWDIPADFQRPDRGSGGGRGRSPNSRNRSPQQKQQPQQNENPETTP